MSDAKPLSTGDVARLLHVTAVAVLRWIRAGKLPAYRVPGGRYRIARAEFRKFLADNQIPVTLAGPSPRRILVVDDEVSVREAFAAALQAKGYEVVLARDVREARRSIRQDPFDPHLPRPPIPHRRWRRLAMPLCENLWRTSRSRTAPLSRC